MLEEAEEHIVVKNITSIIAEILNCSRQNVDNILSERISGRIFARTLSVERKSADIITEKRNHIIVRENIGFQCIGGKESRLNKRRNTVFRTHTVAKITDGLFAFCGNIINIAFFDIAKSYSS